MRINKNKNKRRDKYELRELKRLKVEQATKGEGLYLFVNNTRGDLMLPKPVIVNGVEVRNIPPGRTFEADSYYFNMMKTNQIRLVKVIQDPNKKEETMTEQKLILDQPDRFTQQGKTEHVVPVEKKQLNENQPASPKKKAPDALITEDPMSGVEIILG